MAEVINFHRDSVSETEAINRRLDRLFNQFSDLYLSGKKKEAFDVANEWNKVHALNRKGDSWE